MEPLIPSIEKPSIAFPIPVSRAESSPNCCTCDFKEKHKEFTWQIKSYKSHLTKSNEREASLKQKISDLKLRIKYLEGQLYGKKAENRCRQDASFYQAKTKLNRGQQKRNHGPQRRTYSHLPTIEDIQELAPSKRYCPYCKLPYNEIHSTEDSEEIVVDVQSYRRVIKRKKYKPVCQCKKSLSIVTAPKANKLIPKGKFAVSTWVLILLEKYHHQCPLYRLLQTLSLYGVSLSMGTILDSIQKLIPLFAPIYAGIQEKNRLGDWWHADETRWFVFESQEGKTSFEWYMWVFISSESVVYILDPHRNSQVIKTHLGTIDKGILCTDRFSGYKSFVDSKAEVVWSLCWAHIRRDFLEVGKSKRKYEKWTLAWVKRIGKIYYYNSKRIRYRKGSKRFLLFDTTLREKLLEMKEQCDQELSQERLPEIAKKVLRSLKKYWQELTVFVDNPHIPMDNNAAERKMRIPVVGRKNYYGSGAIWNGHFLATMLSIFQTLIVWNINPRDWLYTYLQACADNGGRVPKKIQSYFPWNMSKRKRNQMALSAPG